MDMALVWRKREGERERRRVKSEGKKVRGNVSEDREGRGDSKGVDWKEKEARGREGG